MSATAGIGAGEHVRCGCRGRAPPRGTAAEGARHRGAVGPTNMSAEVAPRLRQRAGGRVERRCPRGDGLQRAQGVARSRAGGSPTVRAG